MPFPAGGATDAAARAIQPQLEKILGQTVVIENRAGAGAVIGLDFVAKSAPDGYTFGIGPAGAMSVNPAMQVKMPFDVRKDLAAISNLAETPFILAAPSKSKFNSLRDVIAEAQGCARQPVDRSRRQRHVDVFHRAVVHHHGYVQWASQYRGTVLATIFAHQVAVRSGPADHFRGGEDRCRSDLRRCALPRQSRRARPHC